MALAGYGVKEEKEQRGARRADIGDVDNGLFARVEGVEDVIDVGAVIDAGGGLRRKIPPIELEQIGLGVKAIRVDWRAVVLQARRVLATVQFGQRDAAGSQVQQVRCLDVARPAGASPRA